MKKYPLSLLVLLVVIYLSFCTPPSTKLDNVIGFDKVAHFGMYAAFMGVLYWENQKALPRNSVFVLMFSLILFSGLVELLQEYCTSGRRSGDVFDFIANTLGILVFLQLKKIIN